MTWWLKVNKESGNGLVPDGTKPLPEAVLTYCQVREAIPKQWSL